MGKLRKLGLETALAAATAAFLSTPASARELKILTREGPAPKRRARAGPFIAAKGTKIRIGMWRPADTGTQQLEVQVRVLDVASGQVLDTVKKPLAPGKSQLVSLPALADKGMVAFETELAPTLQTSTECDPKLTFRVSFDLVEGHDRAHESRQVWPCRRGGFIRE
jgi:hypothetical protein